LSVSDKDPLLTGGLPWPNGAPGKTVGSRWLIVFALWVPLIFTLLLFLLASRGQRLRDADARWVLHTVEVKDQLEHLNSLGRDIGSGTRGYVLTGDASYLPLYENALKEIPAESEKLAHLVEDNPPQVEAAAHLQVLIAKKLSLAAQALSLAHQQKIPETIEIFRSTMGRALNDEIRAQVAVMTAEEDNLLAERVNAFSSQVRSERNEMIELVAVEATLILALTLLALRLRKLQLTTEVRIGDAHAMTDQAEACTLKAVTRTEQAEVRTSEANTRTEQAEATTALLSTCVSHLRDIVLITGADSTDGSGPRIVFANEAFERMTGYAPGETLGRSPRFLQGEKTDRGVLHEIHEAVALRKPIRRQIINYRKDGTEFWLDIDIVPIFDAAGRCTHFAGIERDITEEKKTDESLNLFRTLMDRSPDAIHVIDPETGRFLDVNATACLRLGYSREEMLSLRLLDIAVPYGGGNPLSLQIIAEATRKAGLKAFEGGNRRKDGSIFPVEANVQYIVLNRDYLVAVVRDITERKRAAEESQRQQSELRALFDLIPAMVWFKDTENGILRVNKRVAEAIGKSVEQIEGKPSLEVYPNEAAAFYTDDLEVIQSGTSKLGIVETIRDRNGEEAWTQTDKVPYCDGEGKIIGIVVMSQDITRRKRTEEARRASDARYQSLFEHAPDGIIILDLERHCLDANASLCRMLGFTHDELVGLHISDIIAETEVQDVGPALDAIRARGDYHKEWKFRRKDGSIFEGDAMATMMPDGNLMAMIRDITERKRNEARFRRLVDSNAQGVIFWNTKGEIAGANDAFLDLVRYTREDLEAGRMNWTTMTPPGYAHFDLRNLEQIADKRVGAAYEKEFIRKDGARVFVLIGGASFEDNPDEGVAFVVDLTGRKRAEEQIAEQAALLDEAQDAIIVRDLEGKAIFWNKGAERMYGWTRQEVLGLNMSGLLFADAQKYEEVISLTISQGKWSGDLKHLTKDKREITIAARWTLIRDDAGRPKSLLAINSDITEKKKIEAQFMRAQRMESIGTLAGGIAHDLNNILAPIMMSIDILKLTATDPQAISILNTIEVSSNRGSDIVRQVLSFARGLDGERVEIRPTRLLKDLESIIKSTFPKNIRLQFTIAKDSWKIWGDPTQVHQILLNLCVNARDAMPNGGNLTIGVENCELDEQYGAMNLQAKAGRYVNISVTDSGTGIPQDILDKIFEPFFTTKEVNEGTGLGLSTVMAIIKSHEGIIDVCSEPGKGSTFKVYLPATQLSLAAQRQLTEQISTPRGKGETVLVVDDEASILTITSQTLQAYGYRVLTGTDGAEAVAVYAKHKNEIAVVLTDMSMPIMDGAAVVRALTRINPGIKIIAASGLNAKGEAAKISGVAVKHFLAKPYTAGTLLKVLRRTLDEA
jgi:PAS domain S-box-containing protein